MWVDFAEENLFGKVRCITYDNYTEVYNEKGLKVFTHEFFERDETDQISKLDEYGEIIEYDEKGRKQAAYSAHLSADDELYREQYSYEGNICTVKSFFGVTEQDDCVKYVFDSNGLLVEKYHFDDHEQKKLRSKEIYEYENKKRIRMYSYNAEDVAENRQNQRGELYRYDERGNLSRVAILCNCCKFCNDPEDWIYFTYKNFDSRGNWLTRKYYHFYYVKFTKREIVYWD